MFFNHLKIAFRNLLRNKAHSFINIAGLSVGMAVAVLIGLWIYAEWSYNRQFKQHTRIAQVIQNQTYDGEIRTSFGQPRQLSPELRTNYENLFKYIVLSTGSGGHSLTVNEKKIVRSGAFMESEAPDLLSLRMLKGSRAGLKDLNSILLSKSVAKAIFGSANPLDRQLMIDNEMAVKVTGVYEDLPTNSSFGELEYIMPWQLLVKVAAFDQRGIGWGNYWFQLFVQISDGETMENVSAKIANSRMNRLDPKEAAYKPVTFLHPMDKWYLYSDFKNGKVAGGRIDTLRMFLIIGVFVLLLACINFMNLSTARSEKRAKEVGIRKAIGSMRGQLISQFFTESLLVASLAFIIAIGLVELFLPWFRALADQAIPLPWSSIGFWISGISFTLITGLIAGTYPALYLSAFKPIKVLKGVFRVGPQAAIPRKVLVVLQFSVSAILIICTVVVFNQIQFAKKRPIGYNSDNLVTVPMKSHEIKAQFAAFRNELLNSAAVLEMTQTESSAVSSYTTNGGLDWNGKPPGMQDEFVTIGTDHQFGKTFQWTISSGRDFSTVMTTDTSGLILNETAVKYMGFKKPIGEPVRVFGGNYKVIGVTKDMVMQSPYAPVRPMFYYIDTFNRVSNIVMRINPNMSASAALAKIEAAYKKFDPANSFEYKFGDKENEQKFRDEIRTGKLASFFAVLAIFISCLGLFGMASFTAEQRSKEIGMRKVLGATVFNLWQLLSKDFVGLVAISLLVAIPTANYFMQQWLQQFNYRTGISWWIFVATGLGALFITLLTVSYQSIKAALVNPVKSLKME